MKFLRAHLRSTPRNVAPHGGAWIEMLALQAKFDQCWSPLMEGRGLKCACTHFVNSFVASPLTEGRGLKCLVHAETRGQARRPSRRGVD